MQMHIKRFFAAVFLFVCFFLSANIFSQKKSDFKTETRQPAAATDPAGYCIALRGNGELEPAHWGALAKTVEQIGMPVAMAGGSSATISMLLMEGIASHPLIENQPLETKKERASLLLKSLLGFSQEVQKTKTWQDFEILFAEYKKAQSLDPYQDIGSLISSGDFAKAKALLHKTIELGVLSEASVKPLIAALNDGDAARAQFYWQELQETAKVFGKFDAEGDDNLFFRAGIIDFENAAVTFGKVAGFYAAVGDATSALSKAQVDRWQKFFDICAGDSKGLSWLEIIKKHPECGAQFHTLFQAHFDHLNPAVHFEEQEIGGHFPVYPTIAVLTDSAAQEYREAVVQYNQKLDHHFGKNFRLSHPNDVHFGYWGKPEDLQKISQSLDSTDEKSRRFMALGSSTWKNVLSLSPAEPGLSPLKEFTLQGHDYVSAGGWSDLQPVLVLKAAGCGQIVYLTRQGGDSVFAQGVAKRLFNFDRDWSLLKPGSEITKKMNNEGDPNDMTSLWSKLYNLGNPDSSESRSLKNANAILCTNWDAFEIQKDFLPLIEDAYRSSYWINPNENSSISSTLAPILQAKKPGCGF